MSESDTDERERIRQQKAEALRERLDGSTTGATESDEPSPTEPVHVSGPDHFAELIDDGVVLVDFYADWCGPCKMLEPIVERIAAGTAATVAKVDVDSQQGLASQYQVQGVPTLYLFADGEPVERLVGARDESTLRSLVEQYA